MATPVKLIEKEFLLKVLYDEQLPVIYHKDRLEYIFYLDKPVKSVLFFKTGQHIRKLRVRDNIELKFDYRGQVIIFTVEILTIKDTDITCTVPDFLYKNLGRSYSRVGLPPEMQVRFTFLGDRYDLSFPKLQQYDTVEMGNFIESIDPRNLSGLIDQMAAWIRNYASGYKLVLFKDVRPSTVDERIIAETGKALYLPTTKGGFPLTDPFPRKKIITEEMFFRYLETTGVGTGFLGAACARFIRAKVDEGIFSDAWIPILFHEYVIGYIHIWISDAGKPPFDYKVVETMFLFTKVLAHSLEINGYFEQGKIRNNFFDGKVIDISASGLLFTYHHSDLSSALLPETKLMVSIDTPDRDLAVNTEIIRRFKDSSHGYFGCQFSEMEQDDLRFLFEFIYGKPFTEFDAKFLAGQV